MTNSYSPSLEYAKEIAKRLHCETVLEDLNDAILHDKEMSGGRKEEVLEYVIHLLQCKEVCIKHSLSLETL